MTQSARVDTVDDPTHDHHRDHRPDSAWCQDQARRDDGIAHEVLKVGRQKRERREQNDADREDEDKADREVAVAKHLGLDEGPFARERVDKE